MRCVIKVGDKYLKGKGYSMDLVEDIWKARIYNGQGSAKVSLQYLKKIFDNKGWASPEIVEVEIYEKGHIDNVINNYFGE